MRAQIVAALSLTCGLFLQNHNANKKLGKLTGKVYYAHLFISWLLLMGYSMAIRDVYWIINYFDATLAYVYVPRGPLPAWFTLMAWFGNVICGLVATHLVLWMASRKEIPRVWLLRAIPFFYIFSVAGGMSGFYNKGAHTHSLVTGILFIAIIFALPFEVIYLFYRSDSVKKYIFCKSDVTPL